jgi:hypothetical protein
MKDSDSLIQVMITIVLGFAPLLVLPGCGESDLPREVPITRSSQPPTDTESRAATKAPRAIATH